MAGTHVFPSLAAGAQERPQESSARWVATSDVSGDSVVGLVVDADTGAPLAGALASVEASQASILVDSAGIFGLDIGSIDRSDFTVVVEFIGYQRVRIPVHRAAGAGIAIQASLKKSEIARCGQVVCSGGYDCDGGVKLIVRGALKRIPEGTPITLVASSGALADTAVTHEGDERATYLAAGETLGVDGPFSATVTAPGFSIWQTDHVWLSQDPCSPSRASRLIQAWLLPPSIDDSLSNKR